MKRMFNAMLRQTCLLQLTAGACVLIHVTHLLQELGEDAGWKYKRQSNAAKQWMRFKLLRALPWRRFKKGALLRSDSIWGHDWARACTLPACMLSAQESCCVLDHAAVSQQVELCVS